MKRGLKAADGDANKMRSDIVEEYSPMKRGLKVASARDSGAERIVLKSIPR